jgi:membrane-associated phospholipid phosphatase
MAISAAIIGTAFALDRSVKPGFPDRVPEVLIEEPGEAFGGATLLIGGTATLATYGAAFNRAGALQSAKRLGLAMGATTATVWAIKYATQRERPDGSDHFSFPSGHTAVAFAAASVLDRQYGRTVGWLAYGAAAMAGEARIADNHHYLSDVVAGAVLGRLIGRLVTLDR